jgi:hypothetical protein
MKKVLLLTALFLGCGDSKPHEWSLNTINTFLTACERGGTHDQCLCALGGVREIWSEEQAIKESEKISAGGPVPNELFEIAKECS